MISAEPPRDPAALRRAVYDGVIFRLPPTGASERLVGGVLGLLRDALDAGDVEALRSAQSRVGAAEVWTRVQRVRARLASEPRWLDAIREVLAAAGLDPEGTAVDVPRLRAVLHDGHLNPAAAPAYFAHRDTWYANPEAQLNWWIPLHDVAAGETFWIYPDRFSAPVANDSAGFDHDAWVARVGWQSAARPADAVYPAALEDLSAEPRIEVAARAGEVILFSGAHLHGTRPNSSGRTRFSVDFRTVDLADHARGAGAPSVDNRSTGSALPAYARPSAGVAAR